MDDARTWAVSYFAARGDAPWRWADDGDVIAWTDGTTIIFRAEVAFVLEWLIPHGWPSFGALVWLFAACRGKLPPSASFDDPVRSALENLDAASGQLPLDFNQRLREMLSVVESGLSQVAKLPEALRTSFKAKAVLAETIFEGVDAKPGEQALRQAVVDLLRSGELTDTALNQSNAPPSESRGEFAVLYRGLKALTPNSLSLRLRTGLDELPRAAKLPDLPGARVRSMLEKLRREPEHAGLARLTRDFMAALQLPRRLSEADEMPIGGFADLSNRGNLDRLLLSELAHDDLTLAVRIALQEALYLRREPPARQPPSTLALLLDAGVRVWGVPRLLATAVALALIGKSASHEKVSVFRAMGPFLAAVDLLSREGLTAHLATLETQAHPGLALPAFHAELEAAGRSDGVIITQRDVAQDPAFRRSLLAAKFESVYLAAVDRDGSFELLRVPHTAPALCRAQVDVNDLFPAPPSAEKQRSKLIDRSARLDLPMALCTWPFPLLIPVRGKIQAAVPTTKSGGICVLQDRRLLRWRQRNRGASIIATELPQGPTLWLGELDDGTVCVVKAQNSQRTLTCRTFTADGEPQQSHDLQLSHPAVRAEAQGNLLYVISHDARVYDLASGDLLASCRVPRPMSHGRYFRTAEKWRLLVWDGVALGLDPVPLPSASHDTVLRVFNRHGHEGPWYVTRGGEVYRSDHTLALRLGALREVVSVSSDSNRLMIVTLATGKTELVDLDRLSRDVLSQPLTRQQWEPIHQPPTASVRTHFVRIAISPCRIHLYKKKGKPWTLRLEQGRLVLVDVGEEAPSPAIPFVAMAHTAATGTTLHLARWPDGRCAWLDDNGLLHLRCAQQGLPEVSIMLTDSPLAAWSSDGLWHGREFFTGENENAPAIELWERILSFTQ